MSTRLLLIACLFFPIAMEGQVFEQEPNNSANTPNVITSGVSITGQSSYSGDIDSYRIVVPSSGVLEITLESNDKLASWHVGVVVDGPIGYVMGIFDPARAGLRGEVGIRIAGGYFVSVSRGNTTANYTLTATFKPVAPEIIDQPRNVTTFVGASADLAVRASGAPPLTYQWYKDGRPIPAMTDSVLHLDNVRDSDNGTYTVVVFNGVAAVTSKSATLVVNPFPATPRLVNLSVLTTLSPGQLLAAGFVVVGNTPRRVLIRAVGPGLSGFGVANSLADPRLALLGGSGSIDSNDNWNQLDSSAMASSGAFSLAANSKDAALVVTLSPGNYTVQVSGNAPTDSGVVLIEVYEAP